MANSIAAVIIPKSAKQDTREVKERCGLDGFGCLRPARARGGQDGRSATGNACPTEAEGLPG